MERLGPESVRALPMRESYIPIMRVVFHRGWQSLNLLEESGGQRTILTESEEARTRRR